jgi:2'-5' RNA ligase
VSTNDPAMPTELRDHWWWRPGWKPGRSFYTWHITFAEQSGVRELANSYAPLLARLPMFDPVPIRWLHLTMQGLGFTDEVQRADVEAIVQATKQRLADRQAFTATIGPPQLDPEGFPLIVRPIEPLNQLRTTVREAIADVWSVDRVPEAAEGWWPHVSLAYSNAAGSSEPVTEALASQPMPTVDIEIAAVSLIDLNRDNKMYEWTDVATVRLGN